MGMAITFPLPGIVFTTELGPLERSVSVGFPAPGIIIEVGVLPSSLPQLPLPGTSGTPEEERVRS